MNDETTTQETLPAPRMEFRWEDKSGNWQRAECAYGLVIPLQEYDIRRTEEQGMTGPAELFINIRTIERTGSGRIPIWGGVVETPFRDGAHAQWDSAALGGLPIYAKCCGVTSLIAKDGGEQMSTPTPSPRFGGIPETKVRVEMPACKPPKPNDASPEPVQWAVNAAQQIHPEYSTEWWENLASSSSRKESYRRLYEEAEGYRMELARKIEAASPVAELTAANAELLAALRPFSKAHAAMALHGVPANAILYAYESGACYSYQFTMRQFSEAALIAKHGKGTT